jgi:hypothetical protein
MVQLKLSKKSYQMTVKKKSKPNNNSLKITQKSEASKQLTLDQLPIASNKVADKSVSRKTEKQIVIAEISALTKIDELSLKVGFRLVPSKTVPTVKSVAGNDLAIISEPEKAVYRKIEKTIEKEQLSERDD